MALWQKADTAAGAPKWLEAETGQAPHAGMVENPNAVFPQDLDECFLVDETEAAVASNRQKGLKTTGWNAYDTYVDGNGATRHRVETLVAMHVTAAEAGDDGVAGDTLVEDATVADV